MPIRILLLEDDPDCRDLLLAHLADVGAEVRTAEGLEDAAEHVTLWTPHVLLVDVGLPHIDGFALVATLRARFPALSEATAIAITAYHEAVVRERAKGEHFACVLTKPIDLDMLDGILAKVLHV